MTCPRDKHGKLLCEIIDHPDRNDQSFCNYCKRRFIKKEETWDFDGVWLLIFILGFLFLTLVLSGCRPNKQSNLLLIRTADIRDEIKSID